jgi:outer membrane biosynthesis protein TonB
VQITRGSSTRLAGCVSVVKPGEVSVSATISPATQASMVTTAFSGVDTSFPVEATGTFPNRLSPEVTTTTAGAELVLGEGSESWISTGSVASPAKLVATVNDQENSQVALATVSPSRPGTTPGVPWTVTPPTPTIVTATVALRPASTGTPAPTPTGTPTTGSTPNPTTIPSSSPAPTPKPAPEPTPKPTPKPTPTSSPIPKPTPTSAPSPTFNPGECANPNFQTSSDSGGTSYGNYEVTNDMWNAESVTQTLYACNYNSWYVKSNMTSQAGAVQTYPNSQMTFNNEPAISSLTGLTSAFADGSTPSGSGFDYEYAYDIWINGYGGSTHTELMIWNYNDGRSPGGNLAGSMTIDGHTYDVYESGNFDTCSPAPCGGMYLAFVATSNFTSGSDNLLDFFNYAVSRGWISGGSSAKLWQVDYGVEICSTNGTTATFDFDNFNVVPSY